MTVVRDDGQVVVHAGDCLDVLRDLPDASIDAVVTDPPYNLSDGSQRGFMGQEWDGHGSPEQFQTWCLGWARECLRVLKPGGHLLAFGGSRTAHRLICAIEDAGFEVRDTITWLYGTGFPKSLDVARAIDRTLDVGGTWRPADHPSRAGARTSPGETFNQADHRSPDNPEGLRHVYEPGSDDARRFQGWGTALKPSQEPIVVARKPLTGTVAANVLEHGTGALNINASRVPYAGPADVAETEGKNRHADFGSGLRENQVFGEDLRARADLGNYDASKGRWPPNVVLTHAYGCEPVGTRTVRTDGHHPAARPGGGIATEGDTGQGGLAERKSGEEVVETWRCAPGCPVAELDAQSGAVRAAGLAPSSASPDGIFGARSQGPLYADAGGASRFFPTFRWQAKAGTDERPRDGDTLHPTVKPLDLMRWLVRLVTPPEGVVLDPFAGSGTTGEACLVEGFRAVLVEREAKYLPLITARLARPIQPTLL